MGQQDYGMPSTILATGCSCPSVLLWFETSSREDFENIRPMDKRFVTAATVHTGGPAIPLKGDTALRAHVKDPGIAIDTAAAN